MTLPCAFGSLEKRMEVCEIEYCSRRYNNSFSRLTEMAYMDIFKNSECNSSLSCPRRKIFTEPSNAQFYIHWVVEYLSAPINKNNVTQLLYLP